MDKTAIKKYAVWARNELIARVGLKANQYGILPDTDVNTIKDTSSINGRVLSNSEQKQLKALLSKISIKGYEQTIEEVAYIWFNRFAALRFMEVNGYLPSHIRVFTDETNDFKPQILDEAINLDSSDFPDMNMQKIMELKQANKAEELYKYLIILQCNALNSILPRMFQKLEDYTELLLPDGLLYEGSIIHQLITEIPEEDWKDAVQIIGWMYQYYNTEPKDKVFDDLKKNIKVTKEKIPAATQLFTPDWIVRYMVENSLGRLWIDGHDDEILKNKWRYYLPSTEQTSDVEEAFLVTKAKSRTIKPEELKCIDPCMGSGHILCYIFEVLVQIYESTGYNSRDAVESIIKNNLFGLDIDERAAQLAYFAVMMKARKYDKRFFTRNLQPQVFAVKDSNNLDVNAVNDFVRDDPKIKVEFNNLIKQMKDATEFGSLVKIYNINFEILFERFEEIKQSHSLYIVQILEEFLPLVQIAKILSQKYDSVITNPPWMSSFSMNSTLLEYVKENYPVSKLDFLSCFIEHGLEMLKPDAYSCMLTSQSWMFLSSFEPLRDIIFKKSTITNLMHLDSNVMWISFGTCATVFWNRLIKGYKGTYNQIKLSDIVRNENNDEYPATFPVNGNRFNQVSSEYFEKIPGKPLAFWLSDNTVKMFVDCPCLADVSMPKVGLQTGDNDRFVRFWYEVEKNKTCFGAESHEDAMISGCKWFPYNKSGNFRKWYGMNENVVNWENNGYEIKNIRDDKGKTRSRPQNLNYYFKSGITWSLFGTEKFGVRYKYPGFIFDVSGSSMFPEEDKAIYILSYLASNVSFMFLSVIAPTVNFQAGDVGKIPIKFDDVIKNKVEKLGLENIDISREDWNDFEVSWEFSKHPLIKYIEDSLIANAFNRWSTRTKDRYLQLKSNEENINSLFIESCCFQKELKPDVAEKEIALRKADLQRDIRSFLSYAVGCMFGRYSLDYDGLIYSGGEWDSGKYSSFIPESSNIISVSDNGYFSNDIIDRLEEFLIVAYGKESIEDNLSFIANALGGKGTSRQIIRDYFLDDFFADHCRIYQKRPIYWLFDSGKKNGFKCLIYMHRYQADTIARIRTDYIHPMQGKYRLLIEDCEKQIEKSEGSTKVKLSKNLKLLHDQAEELRLYEEKIHHLADSMLSINLDDGVKHNYALFQSVLAKIK